MTTTTITKAVLQQLAEAGVRQRLADLEKELATYHKVWPGVFISPTPPQLLKAMPKPESGSSNGHWPAVTFTKPPTTPKGSAAIKASWTPKRRAAHAEHMKERWKQGGYASKMKKALQSKKAKKSKTKKSTKAHPAPVGRLTKVRAYLKQHGESALKDIMAATGYTASASLISAMTTGLRSGIYQRTGKGRYALGPKA